MPKTGEEDGSASQGGGDEGDGASAGAASRTRGSGSEHHRRRGVGMSEGEQTALLGPLGVKPAERVGDWPADPVTAATAAALQGDRTSTAPLAAVDEDSPKRKYPIKPLSKLEDRRLQAARERAKQNIVQKQVGKRTGLG